MDWERFDFRQTAERTIQLGRVDSSGCDFRRGVEQDRLVWSQFQSLFQDLLSLAELTAAKGAADILVLFDPRRVALWSRLELKTAGDQQQRPANPHRLHQQHFGLFIFWIDSQCGLQMLSRRQRETRSQQHRAQRFK